MQGCAVYITDSKGNVILHWAATTGTAPCSLQVRNDGSVASIDANNLASQQPAASQYGHPSSKRRPGAGGFPPMRPFKAVLMQRCHNLHTLHGRVLVFL